MQAEETITHLRFLRIESAILKHNIIEHCETWIYKFTYAIFLLYLLKPTLSVYKLSYKCVKKYFLFSNFQLYYLQSIINKCALMMNLSSLIFQMDAKISFCL
jgi:hypothetical protein